MFLYLLALVALSAAQPAQPDYRVKTLYLVPSDKVPMPNHETELNGIMESMRNWYARELHGRTFDYTQVELVTLDLTEAEMKLGDEDDERMNVFRNAQKAVKDKYSVEYNEKKMIINAFVEVDIWVALGGTGYAVFGNGEQDLSDQGDKYESDKTDKYHLSAFPHEIGHALGLDHTKETLECLAIDDPDGTFMDAIIDNDYEYELEGYQKKLLTDPNYHPECLTVTSLIHRPHPSNYLPCTHKPDINGDGKIDVNDLSQLLVNYGPCENCSSDFNCDGVVDVGDLSLLLVNYG